MEIQKTSNSQVNLEKLVVWLITYLNAIYTAGYRNKNNIILIKIVAY